MSILSSFKKALGFPDEFDDDDDLDSIENESAVPVQKVTGNSAPDIRNHAEEKTIKDSEIPEPADSTLPGEVFDAVIELFNATQPEFVSRCLSIEKQRDYLLERIGESLRNKLAAETADARRRGQQQWESEKKRMAEDIEKIRSEYHSMKQQREEFQSAQLSAARQKRAMTDRIHDLENQVSSLESDREQLQLENRSMINKLRVASVRNSSEDADTESQNKRLAQENIDLSDKVAALESDNKKFTEEIEKLRKDNAVLKHRSETQDEQIEKLNEELEKAGADVDKLTAIAEIEATIQEFEKVKARKDKKISELKAENHKLYDDIMKAGTKVTNAEKAAALLREETDRIKKETEAAKTANETEIQRLNAEIKRLTQLINAAESEKENNERKSRRNRKNHSRNSEAKSEKPTGSTDAETIVTMESHTETTIRTNEETPVQTVKISAIDELMDSTDWFTAPEPVPLKKDPEVEEDFGYKEPPARKTSRDDDKQLSLW